MSKCGAEVLLTYRSRKEQAESVVGKIEAGGGKAQARALDVTDPVDIKGFSDEVSQTFPPITLRAPMVVSPPSIVAWA